MISRSKKREKKTFSGTSSTKRLYSISSNNDDWQVEKELFDTAFNDSFDITEDFVFSQEAGN